MLSRSLTVPTALGLLLAVLAGALVGVAPAATAATDEVMSDAQAGRVYLRAACASNEAGDTFSRIVGYGPDNTISMAELRRRWPRVRAATAPYARAQYRFAKELLHAPAMWPAKVANPVDQTAGKLLRMYDLLDRAASAPTPAMWGRLTTRAHKIFLPTATIRARLDLPPPGRGC